ncbi:MAG: hypothetical protein ING90_21300 [Rhodocyclaceae bacterium]|nr:hypothetical protein [Rhodocyclaceae bacterium]
MTSLLSECEHERDELYARVRELEREQDTVRALKAALETVKRERDEARGQFAHERDFRLAAMRRAERAEADAARLREALADLYAAHDSWTGCRCRTSDVCPSCDRAILAREKARAALAGEVKP